MAMPENLKVLAQIVDRMEKLNVADLQWLKQKVDEKLRDEGVTTL